MFSRVRTRVVRGALLALALLLPVGGYAEDASPAAVVLIDASSINPGQRRDSSGADPGAPADNANPPSETAGTAESAPPPPCSDYEKGFPSCGISEGEARRAAALYHEAQKAAHEQRYEQALDKIKAARDISPRDFSFATAEQAIRSQAAADQVRLGEQATQLGDVTAAIAAFGHAVELDPNNDYAAQRLHDVAPVSETISPSIAAVAASEVYLMPRPGKRSFAFRGLSSTAVQNFAAMFGISAVADEGLTQRNVRIRLDDVDWETGSSILERVCKVLLVPLSEHQVLVASDTPQNRTQLVPMGVQTFYGLGTPEQITQITTALRTLFELRFLSANPSKGTVTIRAPQSTLAAIARFLQDLDDQRPAVMLQIRIFELSTSFTRDIGIAVPNDFTVFNVPSEINRILTGNAFQSILQALSASGQSVNASTILGALLASASSGLVSTPLAQPFATFGGGITLMGVTIPSTSLHFSDSKSLARTVADALLRSDHGGTATLKVGERFPIVTTTYAASTPESSLLASFGITTPGLAATTTVPSPQFDYQDLGLVLKATPRVHGKLVSLEYELAVRAIGATQANGPPVITNRESKGVISTDDGESVVIAGLVGQSEIASINGIPVISQVPGLGPATGVHNKQKTEDELLIVVTPHITLERAGTGVYLPLQMNVPK